MLCDQRQLVGVEEAFQQQDRRADSGLAQGERLLDAGHREAVGLVLQCQRTTHGAVAVGIGLDHRQRAPATAIPPAKPARQPVVVAQRFQVDQGTGGTHRYRLPG